MKFFKYLWWLLKHKFWVTYFCFKEKIVLNGMLHDMSKFKPKEFIAYMNFFYSNDSLNKNEKELAMNYQWLSHQNKNKHHWQYWVLINDDGSIQSLPMPDVYIKEMVCDWIGAGIAIKGYDNTPEWYGENKKNQIMHAETRNKVEEMLTRIYSLEKMKPYISEKE